MFKLLTKFGNRLKFSSVNHMSFSSMKFKELTKKHLKFPGPLKLTIRNSHQKVPSMFMDSDIPLYNLGPIIGLCTGVGIGVYEIAEASRPLSEILLTSGLNAIMLPLAMTLLLMCWRTTVCWVMLFSVIVLCNIILNPDDHPIKALISVNFKWP